MELCFAVHVARDAEGGHDLPAAHLPEAGHHYAEEEVSASCRQSPYFTLGCN